MKFTTTKFTPTDVIRNETLFTTANGNLGFRGDTEEKAYTYHKGTYINGFYDTEPIQYGEIAYGYAKNHETLLNLPDPKRIELSVNNYSFSMKEAKAIQDFSLEIDTNTGILTRKLDWITPDKSTIQLTTHRLVSFSNPHSAVIEYLVKNTSKDIIHVDITSSIDTTSHNIMSKEDPRVGAKFSNNPLIIDIDKVKDTELQFTAQTRKSGLCLAGIATHTISCTDKSIISKNAGENCHDGITFSIELKPSKSISLIKYITYVHGKSDSQNLDFLQQAKSKNSAFKNLGIEQIKQDQKKYLSSFWDTARLTIEGDTESEQALSFNLFQLLQSVSKNGTQSIGAKGLSGEGYEGHFFWDTEAYVCPVFTYTDPHIAESLLAYRARILPQAQEQAKIMNLKGALYPWRTISGTETSAYFPAGTAQYHINADIIFALNRYLNQQSQNSEQIALTKSKQKYLSQTQIEKMAAETARMWFSLGFFNENKNGQFCINNVTGPDEYTAIVNNNVFTNLMARENLYISCRLAGKQATEIEKKLWEKAADNMFIPFDKKLGIYPQDDSFLDKEPWDFAHTPSENYPLLLHYHPLVIYRHRVLKQPDLVLAQFLLSSCFTRAEKIRNFNFYEQYTTGDSSLSYCIQCIMSCETGNIQKAFDYFNETVRMDIDDIKGNVKDGIHTASMAGSWMSVVYGFAGFRDYNSEWLFNPQLPKKWKKITFKLQLEGHILQVTITHDKAIYELCDKKFSDAEFQNLKPLVLKHRNEPFVLDPSFSNKTCKEFNLRPQLRAVLFDLDGVITDTTELHYDAWQKIAQKNNLHFDHDMNKQLLGVSREESLKIILRENNVVWSTEKIKTVCYEKNEIYKESLTTLSPDNILPGIADLLNDLAHAGIKTGLASASKNAPQVLAQLHLENKFTAVADAGKVQMPKPEPDIFLEAADKTNTWYTDCVAIEDAEAGIKAIKKAGIKAVGVCSSSPLNNADVRVKSTSELTLELLKQALQEKDG
ncbi:MAG: beta-phosphoglucomutase [Treponema sp. CETP13]|nr:MAG: beta-phosphoglucomutase [Treponema sp. CETP13]